MIDLRLRSQISDEELEQKIGKIITDDDYNVLLTRDTTIRKPNGQLLCVYRKGVLSDELLDESYGALHSLRTARTENRGLASGSQRVKQRRGERTYAQPVASALIGSFDPSGPKQYCRLTAWSGRETEKFSSLFPLFQRVSGVFQETVPDRFANQMSFINQTHPDWVIGGTVFTTITVNNTYPTGVHTDKGDLDDGFSCLGVLRKGEFTGGVLAFPRYRVGVSLGHGDLILMDAHEWHGNTSIVCACGETARGDCKVCGAERISIVCYYRTKMAGCGSGEEENLKRAEITERYNQRHAGDPYDESDMLEATTTTEFAK